LNKVKLLMIKKKSHTHTSKHTEYNNNTKFPHS